MAAKSDQSYIRVDDISDYNNNDRLDGAFAEENGTIIGGLIQRSDGSFKAMGVFEVDIDGDGIRDEFDRLNNGRYKVTLIDGQGAVRGQYTISAPTSGHLQTEKRPHTNDEWQIRDLNLDGVVDLVVKDGIWNRWFAIGEYTDNGLTFKRWEDSINLNRRLGRSLGTSKEQALIRKRREAVINEHGVGMDVNADGLEDKVLALRYDSFDINLNVGTADNSYFVYLPTSGAQNDEDLNSMLGQKLTEDVNGDGIEDKVHIIPGLQSGTMVLVSTGNAAGGFSKPFFWGALQVALIFKLL